MKSKKLLIIQTLPGRKKKERRETEKKSGNAQSAVHKVIFMNIKKKKR